MKRRNYYHRDTHHKRVANMAVQVVENVCQLDQLKQLEHKYSQIACIEKFILSTHLLQHLLHFSSSGLGVFDISLANMRFPLSHAQKIARRCVCHMF
jgi:hypothetical protein